MFDLGTSTDQDKRFSDKEAKLLKSLKFPPEFDKKVDMRKVNLQVMRPWIVKKIVELVGFEDEVVVEYAMGLLEDSSKPVPDPKLIQINLTGFLTNNTAEFMKDLWILLIEAQESPAGIPRSFVEAKKEEMRTQQANRGVEENQRERLDEIRERERRERAERGGGRGGRGRGRGGGRFDDRPPGRDDDRAGRGRPRDTGWGARGGRGGVSITVSCGYNYNNNFHSGLVRLRAHHLLVPRLLEGGVAHLKRPQLGLLHPAVPLRPVVSPIHVLLHALHCHLDGDEGRLLTLNHALARLLDTRDDDIVVLTLRHLVEETIRRRRRHHRAVGVVHNLTTRLQTQLMMHEVVAGRLSVIVQEEGVRLLVDGRLLQEIEMRRGTMIESGVGLTPQVRLPDVVTEAPEGTDRPIEIGHLRRDGEETRRDHKMEMMEWKYTHPLLKQLTNSR